MKKFNVTVPTPSDAKYITKRLVQGGFSILGDVFGIMAHTMKNLAGQEEKVKKPYTGKKRGRKKGSNTKSKEIGQGDQQ